jgi:hypothetical protein
LRTAYLLAFESHEPQTIRRQGMFSYRNVVGKGCEGWLNLFFNDNCVALVNNVFIADEMRKELTEYQGDGIFTKRNNPND